MTNKQAAIRILKRLRRWGFEALLAGGCVRDMLLGRPAKDYDVTTNARPGDVMKLFKRTLKVGAKFGVVMVLVENQQVEVATFRTEAGYADGRHPSKVKFSSAAEDAARRDFTINGMFYDPVNKKVIDYVAGQADLKKRLVRTIGRPQRRFSEDYLRMLRAIRFSTELGFAIEPKTFQAICSNAAKLSRISAERIAMELEKMLTHPNRESAALKLIKSKLAEVIFCDFGGGQANSGVRVLGQLCERIDFPLALAALFAGCDSDFATKRIAALKLSRNQGKHVKFLLHNRGRLLDGRTPLAQLKLILAEPYFWDLYELQRAIQKVNHQTLAGLMTIRKRARALAGEDLRPRPLLDGHELIRLGAVPGPQVGQLAQEMYILQLGGELADAEDARRWVRKWLGKRKATEN